VAVALGIDERGEKHVLGLHEGATENESTCRALIEDLVARGVRSDRSRLFVIDGSKALVAAIRKTFGRRALVQRRDEPARAERVPNGACSGRIVTDVIDFHDAKERLKSRERCGSLPRSGRRSPWPRSSGGNSMLGV